MTDTGSTCVAYSVWITYSQLHFLHYFVPPSSLCLNTRLIVQYLLLHSSADSGIL